MIVGRVMTPVISGNASAAIPCSLIDGVLFMAGLIIQFQCRADDFRR